MRPRRSSGEDPLNQRRLLVAVPVLLVVVVLLSVVNREYRLDDALIYYRYIRNCLAGHGLVYNVGEYFNGLTSPLHTYLSLLVCGLAGSIRYPMIVQSALTTCCACVVLFVLYARVERRWHFVLLGAVLVAGSRFTYSLYGMESPLFLLLCAVCLLLYDARRTFWLGIACALLVLTRGEGAILVLALGAVHLLRRRPLPPWRDFVAPALLLAGQVGFHYAYYGTLLPQTLMAKVYQGRSGMWGEWPIFLRAGYHVDEYFGGSAILLGLCVALALVGTLRLGGNDLNLVVVLSLSGLTLFYVALNIPNYHWYYAPFYAFGLTHAGIGAASLYERASRIRGASSAVAARVAVVLVGIGVAAWSVGVGYAQPVSGDKRQVEYPPIGEWLAENTAPDASIALVEVGIIGYYSRRPIVDILGVVSPRNAKPFGERRFSAWLDNYDPDLILMHVPPFPHERGVAAAVDSGRYRLHPVFRARGYALLERSAPR